MAQLTVSQFPPLYRYEGETLRVVAIAPSFESLLAESFDQIRDSGKMNIAILVRMLGALDTIGSLTNRHSHLLALGEQLMWIAE